MSNDNKKSMSKIGFILSAIGAAVGLGNIWGFPTKMMSYGGPAFLIPYIVGVVLLGLPFLILEINLGSKWRKAPANFYHNYLGGAGRPFAWLQASVQLLIGTYYAIIISWVVISIGVSFTDSLGEPGYFSDVIQGTKSEFSGTTASTMGKIQPLVFLGFFGVIALSGIIVSFGIDKGIERANKIMVPFLFALIVGIFLYSLSLTNASQGLDAMFKPDIDKIGDTGAWRGAFSQAFFTLSLAVSIIIVYSIHSPKGGDNTNRAITIMSGDTLIALLACVIIGATLGYAAGSGVVVEGSYKEVAAGSDTVTFTKGSSGSFYLASAMKGNLVDSNLKDTFANTSFTTPFELTKAPSSLGSSSFVFRVFPQTFRAINNEASDLGNVLGFLFYLAVFFAAMSSMISLLEPSIANFQGAHGISRPKGVIACCLIMFTFGLPFAFQSEGTGSLMDLTDGFFTGYFLLISAFIGGAMVVVSRQKTKELTDLNNKSSMYKLGSWYRWVIIFALVLIFAVFILGILANAGVYPVKAESDFASWSSWQWGILSLCYFVPFSILVFGYGLSDYWKKWLNRGGRK